MNKLFVIILFAVLNFGHDTFGLGQRILPEVNLSMPILVILESGETASGFYLTSSNKLYFVTARHVLFKSSNQTNLTVKASHAILSSYSYHINSTEKIVIRLNAPANSHCNSSQG